MLLQLEFLVLHTAFMLRLLQDQGLIVACNYIFFTKLAWPGDCKGTLQSLSQAVICLPHLRWRLRTISVITYRQVAKLRIPIFIIFSLTRPRIETKFILLVADVLSTLPLIGLLGWTITLELF